MATAVVALILNAPSTCYRLSIDGPDIIWRSKHDELNEYHISTTSGSQPLLCGSQGCPAGSFPLPASHSSDAAEGAQAALKLLWVGCDPLMQQICYKCSDGSGYTSHVFWPVHSEVQSKVKFYSGC